MTDKVLITGAAGFIGYNLACDLYENTDYDLYLVDSFARGRKDEYFSHLIGDPRVHFKEGDVTDPQFFDSLPEFSLFTLSRFQYYHFINKLFCKIV